MTFLSDYNIFHKFLFFNGFIPFYQLTDGDNNLKPQTKWWRYTLRYIIINLMIFYPPYITYLSISAKSFNDIFNSVNIVYNIMDTVQMLFNLCDL